MNWALKGPKVLECGHVYKNQRIVEAFLSVGLLWSFLADWLFLTWTTFWLFLTWIKFWLFLTWITFCLLVLRMDLYL